MEWHKLFKTIAITLTAGMIVFSGVGGSVAFAEDMILAEATSEMATDAEPAPEEPAPPQTEAPPPQTEPPAPQTEAPAPQTEPPAPQTEAPAPQTEAPVQQTEAPASQTETQAQETSSETGAGDVQVGEEPPIVIEGQSETNKETEKETEPSSEIEMDENDIPDTPYASNSELIAAQNIIHDVKIYTDFRFKKIDNAKKVIIKSGAYVYEEMDETSKEVGVAINPSMAYILAEENGWYYIESENVRGFVKPDKTVSGKLAETLMLTSDFSKVYMLVPTSENHAVNYTLTTSRDLIIPKEYAVAKTDTAIYERKSTDSRKVGELYENAVGYVILDRESDFIFVESGDVRGFVPSSDVVTGSVAVELVSDLGETKTAKELISPDENEATYYSLASVKEASDESYLRKSIVEFALQFLGNPYVWGGTSLTNGCDCSGFAQSVYANFGYSIPRVACDQACYGKQVDLESAKPGDLIFFAKNGYVYHTSMYIGDGKIVHALSTNTGIVVTDILPNAVWAVSIVD